MMRRKLMMLMGPLVAFILLGLGYIAALQWTGNFHEVLAGELYRSSQPSPAQLAYYIEQHHIRTVINLRGQNGGSRWYQDEVATARALGVEHVDFSMSARRPLSRARAKELIAIMRDAPKPILIHCRSGADRTGLASAIYLGKIAGLDDRTAEGQLSFRYGHLGIPILSSAYPMNESWESLESLHAEM